MPRGKLVFNRRMLEQALDLKAGIYVTGFYVYPQDPPYLQVLIEGDDLPTPEEEQLEDSPSFIFHLNEVSN